MTIWLSFWTQNATRLVQELARVLVDRPHPHDEPRHVPHDGRRLAGAAGTQVDLDEPDAVEYGARERRPAPCLYDPAMPACASVCYATGEVSYLTPCDEPGRLPNCGKHGGYGDSVGLGAW
jgi:hypothetical protein